MAELAEKFSLGALEATVERYNGFCDAGETGTSARSAPFLKPVKSAPFYIFEYVPSAWGTNGGVKVDSHLRAMDAENNPHSRPVRGRRRSGQRLLRAVLHESRRVCGTGLGFRRVRGAGDSRGVKIEGLEGPSCGAGCRIELRRGLAANSMRLCQTRDKSA